MNRNTRTIVVICVALVTASIATFLVYRAVAQMAPAAAPASVSVVVAARSLPAGTLLTKADVKLVSTSPDQRVTNSFSTIAHVLNRGLQVPLEENEPLTESKLALAGAGVGLVATIPDGMRGVSVRVDDVVSVAGYVGPGAHVDLLATFRTSGRGAVQESVARTILSNVLVLGVGTKGDLDRPKDSKAPPSSVVTLAVTPADAEKIAIAASEGRITLALRKPLDNGPSETTGIGVAALVRGSEPPPPAAPPVIRKPARRPVAEPPPPPVAVPPIPEPEKYTVKVIRAGKETETEVP
jgi:pilus assembly protein CpaB